MQPIFILAALASTSASSVATVGPLTITGVDGTSRHSHGAAARLGSARFSLLLTGEQPVSLTVSRVEYLTGHDCDGPPTTVRSTPAFSGLISTDPSMKESVKVLEIAPGDSGVWVGFEPVEAAYSHCDRFAFRVVFEGSWSSQSSPRDPETSHAQTPGSDHPAKNPSRSTSPYMPSSIS